MRIHGFHDNAACGQIRVVMPLAALRDLGGHQVTMSLGWGTEARNEDALGAEMLIGQRLDRAEATALWRRLAPGRRLVYELDDDVWNVDPANWQAARLRKASVQDAVETAITVSDLVTVSTPPLAEIVSKFNRNVVVLPNHIDGRILQIERPRREKLVVGWAGGSSHLRDLEMIASTLRRFLRRHPEAELHNIGSDFREAMKVPGRWTDWCADIFEYYRAIDFDIALAPVTSSVFSRSKSGIKALEAMALGIPVIASDLEPYQAVVDHGRTGFLVRRPHEWAHYLWELARDPDLRERIGHAGREAVRQRWQIQNGWRLWEEAYSGALTRRAMPVGGSR